MRQRIKSLLKKDALVIIFFALLNLVFFWKYFLQGLIPIPADLIIGGYFPWLNEKWGYVVGVPVKNALMSDVVSLLYPWRKLAIDLMKSGQLPLWDSTSFLGTSLIGNFQAAAFNPFNLLFLLPFSFNQIWGLQVVIQPFIAMLSMYLLLRNWKLTKLSSIFASISFAFSAQMLVWIEYNAQGFIIAAFPLLILLIDKYINSQKLYYLSGISLLIAYIVFVGYPQHLYYFTLFGFIYLFFNLLGQKKYKDIVIDSSLFGLFIILGLALSGVSLLPGIEALSLSIKSLDNIAEQNAVLYLPWQNLITAFVPDYFGNPATNNYYGIGHYESLIFYSSIIALPFSAVALTSLTKKKPVYICLIFLTVAFLLALKTPISQLIQHFSFIGLTGSVSSRVLFIYSFSISALAAIGLDRFRESGFINDKSYAKYLPLLLISGITFGTFLSFSFIKTTLGNINLVGEEYSQFIISFKNLVIPLGLAVSVSLIIIVGRFRLINKNFLLVILIALILIDYSRFSAKYLPFLESEKIYPQTASLSFLKNSEQPFRIAIQKGELLPANTWSVFGIESITGYNILLPKTTADYISFLNNGYISEGYVRFIDIGDLNSKFLDIANVNYLLALLRKDGVANSEGGIPYEIDSRKYTEFYKEGAVAIYKNNNVVDRFYTPTSAQVETDTSKVYQIINNDSFDTSHNVVIDRQISAADLSECKLLNLNYTSQKMSLSADCPKNGLLAFSNLYYPGWQATINNQKVEIIKSNGIFSAVELPPGKSSIRIIYLPDSFKYGLLLSLLTASALVVLSLWSLKHKRINNEQ